VILLIGATGFLGSYVANRLADRELAVLARRSSDLGLLPPSAEVRHGDLDNAASLEKALQGVTEVVYCASMGFGQIPGLVSLLERRNIQRAVFVSTTAIFTRLPAASKRPRLAAERAVQQSILNWTILRPTMIYGSERDRNIARLLKLLKRLPVYPLVGGGSLHQPVHVEDLADAVVAALDRPAAIGKAYDVSGAEPLTYEALVRAAARAVGRDRLALVPLPLGLALLGARVLAVTPLPKLVKPEQVLRLAEDKAFDWSAAGADLGFNPRTFEVGVAQQARSMGLA
jgi:uncharacterized protein YbjT (DUF2867 family)